MTPIVMAETSGAEQAADNKAAFGEERVVSNSAVIGFNMLGLLLKPKIFIFFTAFISTRKYFSGKFFIYFLLILIEI